jgi:hypothetical protein
MFDAVALLARAPRPIRRLASRVAAGRGPLGRCADVIRFRYRPTDIPHLPAIAGTRVRLTIGPANSAGQGFLWARAVERANAESSALSIQGTAQGPFRAEVDLRVPIAVFQRSADWHSGFQDYLEHQTHVIWESGMPLLGRRYGGVAAEAQLLGRRGVRGALMFHGSDIRPPARHAVEEEWSPFRDHEGPIWALDETAEANARLAASSGLPSFVSTPDLLRWLPGATWCPVVVDPARWRDACDPAFDAGISTRRPIVAHAPSQGWLKGTNRIEPTLHRLAAEGLIDYRRIVDVPHSSMPAFYAEADIVLDQFLLGSYGVAACEAMASGRLVIGHVDALARATVSERTGLSLPVHEATVGTLESEIRRIVGQPELFAAARAAGPAFVEAVHDGRRSAAALAPFLTVAA